MSTAAPLQVLFEVQSSHRNGIASPPIALRRDEYAGYRAPSAYELEHLNSTYQEATELRRLSMPHTPAGSQTPVDPDEDLESRPASPLSSHADIVPSLKNPSMNRWRFITTCCCFLAMGMNDASTGALIPYMESHYDIPYGIVSMIFVCNAVGFILAATFTNKLQLRVGRGWHMLIAQSLMVLGYTVLVSTPPFPAVCIAFFLTGLGIAMGLAPSTVFVTSLTNSTTLLGIMHGVYGLGGVLGPLIATAMVARGAKWSSYYGILLAICAVNATTNYWTNRHYEQDKPSPLLSALQHNERLRSGGSGSASARNTILTSTVNSSSPPSDSNTPPARTTRTNGLRQTLSRTTYLGACFIFAYQGAEVSMSGWVISFLLAYRAPPYKTSFVPSSPSGYNPLATGTATSTGSLGYVTSGFWAGLTLSRLFATDRLASVLGDVYAVASLTVLAGCFQLLVWLVPNLIAESVVIAILGMFLGPVYPLATAVFSRYLDRKVQVSSLAIVTAMGSSGGALAPFLVGVVSQAKGVWVLHPICLGLYGGMGALWVGLNWGRVKRRD